jgi:NADH-quinone oxidoreductase subunit L
LLAFHGEFRGSEEQRAHLHESPAVMTWPLWVLAVGAVGAGYVGIPRLGHFDIHLFDRFLAPVMTAVGHHGEAHHASVAVEVALMVASVVIAAAGIWLAWKLYGAGRGLEGGAAWAQRYPAIHRALVNKYWVDEAYDATVVRGTWGSARGLYRFDSGVIDGLVNGCRHFTVGSSMFSGFFDKYVVDGLVNLVGWMMQAGSRVFRRLQTGLVSQYAMVVVAGMLVLVFFVVLFR